MSRKNDSGSEHYPRKNVGPQPDFEPVGGFGFESQKTTDCKTSISNRCVGNQQDKSKAKS